MAKFEIKSTAFPPHGDIPSLHTCEGRDKSPPLDIIGVHRDVKSLVLIVEDPDAPDPEAPKMVFDHWLLYNIPPATVKIPEGMVPTSATQGKNGWGKEAYGGPCPPVGKHRYFFKLFALDEDLGLPPGLDKDELTKAMEGHVLAETELVGLYEKHGSDET